MSMQTLGIVLCCVFVGIAIIACICDWDRDNPLPKPQTDTRDWQGTFMKDWKR